jgi:hypothetical protein
VAKYDLASTFVDEMGGQTPGIEVTMKIFLNSTGIFCLLAGSALTQELIRAAQSLQEAEGS